MTSIAVTINSLIGAEADVKDNIGDQEFQTANPPGYPTD